MAFTCGFFNSVNHDRKYDAVQHGMVFDGIITDGIYATYLKAMVVKASSNPSEVIVQPGRAWFNHTWSYNDADYPVAAPDPEVVLDRIDTLVLDVNNEDAVRNCQFLWVQGTPTSQVPEPPELIHTATHNQYPLCDVYRQAGTTQIYAADITNRVGTSDCPFVTGVLEGINIDDLLAQWDDEFHTWENATKASFEGWMLNQQAVYTAWWDALKTQMAGDVDDVEEWIQTIKDIIDEETATHLQLEIDEINSMLPSGSHITVTTTDTELYSRTVTITDEDNNTVTSQFDATGVAVFKSVPYVGNLTIEATDGIRTATAVVNTPYFARYEFPLAFWSATVNITGDTELGGETVTITDSSQILVGTVVLNASGAGVFNATYPDTYKFSVTHGGQTMEVSLAVTQETTYNVTIHAGFNWRGWVDAAQYLDSSDYNSLDEVLADELAVRELCLEHACVDYLAAVPSVNADIETVINNDLFAKWANNSDYSLDVLGANVAIKALMDTADKYGYGEWTLVGQVPTMTSNSAPYGEAFADSYNASGHDAYTAFDQNTSTNWNSSKKLSEVSSNVYVGYHSTSPICVKRFSMVVEPDATAVIKLQGSNDGTNYTDIGDTFNVQAISTMQTFEVPNNTISYSYHRVLYVSQSASNMTLVAGRCLTLQFYAWAPKGNVPVMTSNTAPYGEASVSSNYSGSVAYKAFNGVYDSCTNPADSDRVGSYLQYKFTNPTCIKRVYILRPSEDARATNKFELKASNDGTTWQSLGEYDPGFREGNIEATLNVDNDEYYLIYRIVTVNVINTSGYQFAGWNIVQFFGRELSVSVPTMTSNTAPYGEAFASSVYTANSEYLLFANGDFTPSHNAQNPYCGYDFGKAIKIRKASFYFHSYNFGASNVINFRIIASNDKQTWENVSETMSATGFSNATSWLTSAKIIIDVSPTIGYRYYAIQCDGVIIPDSNHMALPNSLQFYGFDYSEKEFEQGTTKKWLYDHGVELEPLDTLSSDNNVNNYVTKKDDELYIHKQGSNSGAAVITNTAINLTSFSLIRARCGDELTRMLISVRSAKSVNDNVDVAVVTFSTADANLPNNLSLDVSAVNQSEYPTIGLYQGGTSSEYYMTVKEWWLE